VPALVIGIGNPLRRDDGVAHAGVELCKGVPGLEVRHVQQLVPEIADGLAAYDLVIFADADFSALDVTLQALEPDHAPPGAAFAHHLGPRDLVAIARGVFGFRGRAFLCRIPVSDVGAGEGLSERAGAFSRAAAALIISAAERRMPQRTTSRGL